MQSLQIDYNVIGFGAEPFRGKYFQKKKKKKKKVPQPVGRKMLCNIFLKKYGRFFFRAYIFSKNPKGLMLLMHFPDCITLLSFFYFFIRVFGRNVQSSCLLEIGLYSKGAFRRLRAMGKTAV